MNEDDEPVIKLTEEEVQEIIDWSLSAGAMITLMHHAPVTGEHETVEEKLNGFIQAVEVMYENIPDILVTPTHNLANSTIEEAAKDEAIIEQFRQQIEEL